MEDNDERALAPHDPLAFLPPAKDHPAKLLVTCAEGVLRTKTLSSLHR